MLLTHICFDFYPPFLTRVSFYFLGWREQNHNGLKRTRYEISKFVFLFNVFFFITFKESRSSWARGHQNAFDLNWVDSIQSRVSGNRVHVSILALLVISLNRQQTFTKRGFDFVARMTFACRWNRSLRRDFVLSLHLPFFSFDAFQWNDLFLFVFFNSKNSKTLP